MQRFVVPQLPLHGPKDFVLTFPSTWDVEMRPMAGHNRPEIGIEDVRMALRNPIGSSPLRELASGRKQVAILVDDNSRGMRWEMIAHIVLEELEAAGVHRDNIRFIFALGVHGTLERTAMVQKLSEDIVRDYFCFNHNAFSMCKKIGETKTWNIDVHANEEVMACDLKIALGAITPHPINGFGGGSKIVMPGIVSFETIAAHHEKSFEVSFEEMTAAMKEDRASKVGLGLYDEGNAPAVDADDEMADLVGLDFVVDVVVNTYGRPVSVWTGDFREAFRGGVDDGRKHYATEGRLEQDIVIANCFYKANEDMIGLTAAPRSLKRSGGSVVLISNTPEGACNHYFAGNWGTLARPSSTRSVNLPDYVHNLIIYNEYPHRASNWWIEPAERITHVSRWEDVLALLSKWHPGDPAAVVYPDVTLQYPQPRDRFKQHETVPAH